MLDLVLHDRRPDALEHAVGGGEDRKAGEHDAPIPEELACHGPVARHVPETRPREGQPAGRNEDRDPEHRRGAADQIEQRQGPEAAESRAEQVRCHRRCRREGAAGQGQADNDAGEEERQREGDGELGPDDECHDRCGQARDDGQLHQERQDRREGEAERGGAQVIGQLLRAVPLGAEVDPDRSGGEAEHRDADDEKREVIPGGDGNDPGFDDLQHQGRRGDQAEACIEWKSLRNLMQPSPPCWRIDRGSCHSVGQTVPGICLQQADRHEIRRGRTVPQIESDVSLAAKQSSHVVDASRSIEAELLERTEHQG